MDDSNLATLYTSVGHRDRAIWNPLSDVDLDRALEAARLGPQSCVVDVGCGGGEVLRRIAERFGARGVGIDRSSHAIAIARALEIDGVEFVQRDFDLGAFDEGAYDLVVCLGASHAVGTVREAIERLVCLVRPGGRLLSGEGFWAEPPAPEYLAWIETEVHELPQLGGLRAMYAAAGLVIETEACATRADWVEYEAAHAANIRAYAAARPDDSAAKCLLDRSRHWQEGSARWGRETLGFALTLGRRCD